MTECKQRIIDKCKKVQFDKEMQWNIEHIDIIIIKLLKMNQILTLNNP